MIDKELSSYYYNTISEIISDDQASLRERVLSLYSILKDSIKQLTINEKQIFASNYAKFIYVLDKVNLSSDRISSLKSTRHFLEEFHQHSDKILSYDSLHQATANIILFINEISDTTIPEELTYIITPYKQNLDYKRNKPRQRIGLITVVVKEILSVETEKASQFAVKLLCYSQDYDEIIIYLEKKWKEIANQVCEGSLMNLTEVKKSKEWIETTYSSIVILEPEFYTDATEIAELFNSAGWNPASYFIKRYSSSSVSTSMVIGNIVNYLFDSLIEDIEANFDEKYLEGLKVKPLQIFSLATKDIANKAYIRQEANKHFYKVQNQIQSLALQKVSIEPSFSSEVFGLQGRLDLLIEYENDDNRKDVIELKSGRAPGLNLVYKNSDGSVIKSGIWLNHLAQATVYNMLLDTAFKDRKGSSMILYSQADDSYLRNAPNIISLKQEIMKARNEVISNEIKIANGEIDIIDFLEGVKGNELTSYVQNDLNKILLSLRSLNTLENSYFRTFSYFIFNELISGRINSENFITFKLNSRLNGKLQNGSSLSENALGGLKLINDECDFEKMHLSFEFTNDDYLLSSYRKGDMIVLFPVTDDSEKRIFKGQLLKCVIKGITRDRLRLSLRNKLIEDKFDSISLHNGEWAIDNDTSLTSTKSLFRSLVEFLHSDKRKREILLGIRKPEYTDLTASISYLSEKQNEILSRALSANDYYLIQGPPGTGKTSYMLRALAETLLNTTEYNILILAYTNRAIDEIISSLRLIECKPEIIRLGNKESSEQTDVMLSYIVEQNDLNIVFKKIKNSRIIVSTVSSALTNPEIFDIKKFDILIVDEASQILESYLIGIVSKIKKFILIGDEKQLPAITLQNKLKTIVTDEELKGIQLNTTDSSLFERLLMVCKSNGWNDSYSLLDKQARMHHDIMEFPNTYFYNNELSVFDETKQSSEIEYFHKDSEDEIERLLADYRIIFIESKPDIHQKVNISEVEATVKIIETIKRVYGNNFNESTVGVISPFRAQCASILKRLPIEYSDIVSVDTVERFQGSEREIIILSTATNSKFLLDRIQSITQFDNSIVDRKLNVSMTRARNHLIIIGNPYILESSPIYRELINFIKNKKAYFRLTDFDTLIKIDNL
jgi:DNA replication ATP-dependent helicase Dna2